MRVFALLIGSKWRIAATLTCLGGLVGSVIGMRLDANSIPSTTSGVILVWYVGVLSYLGDLKDLTAKCKAGAVGAVTGTLIGLLASFSTPGIALTALSFLLLSTLGRKFLDHATVI